MLSRRIVPSIARLADGGGGALLGGVGDRVILYFAPITLF